ncbi:Cytochrome c553 [Collimonas sp. OK307]|uniref:c-type cytochrome n=1 Tax=Collimonas sp. OK307 TaxID=1801620 RepID=UPI0008E1D181|nr:c-type cytochrome [Collimonas sp. OK307]SFH61789.1 Cytochrome c553 [Collimonas sp. OK307]
MTTSPAHKQFPPRFRALTAASLTCCSLLLSAVPAIAADQQNAIPHGRQLAQACAACHGINGNTANPALYPNLAGQAPAYLELQLANFKSGERPNPIMKGFAASLKESDMHDLSMYFGAQAVKAQLSSNHELEEKGKRIFTKGSAAGAPACASCHGAEGHGQAAFPRIASQPAGYTLEQLHVYRDAPKFNNPLATVMKGVAVKLSEDEMKSVSAYIATVP